MIINCCCSTYCLHVKLIIESHRLIRTKYKRSRRETGFKLKDSCLIMKKTNYVSINSWQQRVKWQYDP